MRPDAPLVPCSVWHELQSPLVCGVVIVAVRPAYVTRAVYGSVTVGFRGELKLPLEIGRAHV
jgi:hypothetical protein